MATLIFSWTDDLISSRTDDKNLDIVFCTAVSMVCCGLQVGKESVIRLQPKGTIRAFASVTVTYYVFGFLPDIRSTLILLNKFTKYLPKANRIIRSVIVNSRTSSTKSLWAITSISFWVFGSGSATQAKGSWLSLLLGRPPLMPNEGKQEWNFLKRPRELCVGLGQDHGEEDDDNIGIAVEEAGEGGAVAAALRAISPSIDRRWLWGHRCTSLDGFHGIVSVSYWWCICLPLAILICVVLTSCCSWSTPPVLCSFVKQPCVGSLCRTMEILLCILFICLKKKCSYMLGEEE